MCHRMAWRDGMCVKRLYPLSDIRGAHKRGPLGTRGEENSAMDDV